jgi:hypothetical protein
MTGCLDLPRARGGVPTSRSSGGGSGYFIVSICAVSSLLFPETGAAGSRKIIEWGWGTPETTYIRAHVKEMERLPFDGLGLDLKADSGPPNATARFSWKVWGAKVLQRDDYAEAIEALCGTQFERFTDNFLRFNVTPGYLDWYEEDFSAVVANARLAAQIARECRLKGLLFDVEHYGGKPFHYASRSHKGEHSFAAYERQVRQRGREFMQALLGEYPEITILLTYGYHVAYRDVTLFKSLASTEYGLLPAFLDGMLEAAGPDTLIFDGWESAYGYKEDAQLRKNLERTSAKDQFRRHYRASFGLRVDNGQKWDATDLSKNYFSPAEFERSVRSALKHTDRYLWIYSEKARWWDGQVPQAYIDALTRARTSEGVDVAVKEREGPLPPLTPSYKGGEILIQFGHPDEHGVMRIVGTKH